MGIQERRERERLELRVRILNAARELFAKRGYEAVTMREIARRIEYSPTALYGHFEDKETLFRELCRQDFSEFAQSLLREVASVDDPVEQLCHAGIMYLSFAEHYPEHYRLMFLEEHPDITPTEAERNDPAQNAYLFLRALVVQLIEMGALRPELKDVDLVAQTVWAGVHGAAALDVTSKQNALWLDMKPRSERFRATLELLLRGLTRHPEEQLAKVARALGSLDESAKKRPREATPGEREETRSANVTRTDPKKVTARSERKEGGKKKPAARALRKTGRARK